MAKPTLKTLLADLEADDLREVVAELCKLSPQNRTFVDLFLRGSDDADTEAVLAAVDARLRACFLRGARPKARPNLAEARRIVTEHERLAADYPALAAEAALLYAEAAAAYAEAMRADYRFVPQSTVEAALRMMERFVRAALARPARNKAFEARAAALAAFHPRMQRLVRALTARDAALLDPEAASEGETYRVVYDQRLARDDEW